MFHFMVKPRPLRYTGLRHAGERGGFLGDGQGAGNRVGQLVEAFQKVDSLQVLVAAVHIWNPLAGFARVIQIQHGSDRVHAQAVDVVLLQPEQAFEMRNERTSFRPKLKISVPQSLCSPIRGSACS